MTSTRTGLSLSDVPYEAIVVDKQLREGAPTLGWRGDPRLSLEIGLLKSNNTGYNDRVKRWVKHGEVLARQLVVTRHCEDGTDQVVLRRKYSELGTLIQALIKQDPRTPGFEDVMDTVEREGAAKDKQVRTDIFEARAQAAEHLWALVGDRQNGRTTFRGLPGSNPDKQL